MPENPSGDEEALSPHERSNVPFEGLPGAERWVVYSGGERVGSVDVRDDGAEALVDYRVDTNGRGAKLREHIGLDPSGLPRRWEIDGTSLMGGAVRERFTVAGNRCEWTSQADEGDRPAHPPALYLANDTSPYASGVYARAALAAGGTVDALPSGKLTVKHLRPVRLAGTDLEAYVLAGVGLFPEFVLLDEQRRMVAKLGGTLMVREVVVREDHADAYPELVALDRELGAHHARRIQHRIRHRFDTPVRVRDVRVFDPHTLTLTGPCSVVFFRGRVTAVERGSELTSGEVQIDGQGGTLLAGLHDMHTHTTAAAGSFFLAAGVTTVRDMGNDNAMLLDLIPKVDSGELPGPTIVPSGLIEGRSPYSAALGVLPETLEEAIDAVRWYAARGYHQIKIYNSVDPSWPERIAAEAHRLGLRVTGHVPAFTTPDEMMLAGFDEITHINQLVLGWLLDKDEDTRTPLRLTAMARARDLDLDGARVRRTLGLMRRLGVGLDTTAVILERLMLSRAGQVQQGDVPYLYHTPVGYQRYRRRTFVPAKDEEQLRAYEESFPVLLRVMAMLHEAGVPLWPGTDDGTGFTLHRELELYVAAGIPAARVLRMATLDCAEHLGRGWRSGSVELGKDADLVLLDGDPTLDISAIRRIRMVVKRGDVYFPAEIYPELNIAPFGESPAIQTGVSQ